MILVNVLIGLGLLVLLALTFAPLESLGWWAREGADEAAATVQELAAIDSGPDDSAYDGYVVYLSGIGAVGGDSVPPEELPLIQNLSSRLTRLKVIHDVFPYSVSNNGLTAQRPTAAVWRWVEKLRFKNPETLAGMLINARNAMQLFVCADRRYGPAYNVGTAQEVMRALRRHGYPMGSGLPVTLIGWSGGAQISIGAAWYLGMGGRIPLQVISVGGMMADDYGLDRIQKLWHLRGSKDPLEKLGGILFAGRWPHAVFSPWTNALKDGRIEIIDLGPMQHNVKDHYFDANSIAPDGRSYLQVTEDAIVAVLTGEPVKTVPLHSVPTRREVSA
ncbi:MAG TPA: hypothetical protein PKJ61_01495 [Propionicimonas sp.]|nr:hypothetical protein [Propionicimonas sp.]HQD97040.1 hypothetical protein [Propionicimonas sp.]